MGEALTLAFYDAKCLTTVTADASSYDLGAAILHQQKEQQVIIAYVLRTLSEAENRYAQIKKECWPSVWACEKFSKYLVILEAFTLQTDHKLLLPLMEMKDLDRAPIRCQKLLIRLMRYNFKVVHIPGRHLTIADGLSIQLLKETSATKTDVEAYVASITVGWPASNERLDMIRETSQNDAQMMTITE